MPNFEAHRKIGFIASMLLGTVLALSFHRHINLEPLDMILVVPVIWFYSNLPDVDHHQGKLRRYLFTTVFTAMILSGFILLLVSKIIAVLVLTLAGMVGVAVLRTKHRGPLHSYLFVILMAAPWLFMHWFLFALAVISGWSHIFIDGVWSGFKRKVRKVTGTQNKKYSIHIEW